MTTTAEPKAAPPEAIRAIPVRHPGRWVAIGVLAVLAAMLLHAVFTNQAFHWDVVGQYLFDSSILSGVRATLILTVLSMVIGVVGGIVLAVMRLSPNPVLKSAAWVYIWVFRGTPLLVQLYFIFYVLPDFGIRTFLPPHRTTPVEFTPERAGSFEFTCGMGMVRGRVIAEDAPGKGGRP